MNVSPLKGQHVFEYDMEIVSLAEDKVAVPTVSLIFGREGKTFPIKGTSQCVFMPKFVEDEA